MLSTADFQVPQKKKNTGPPSDLHTLPISDFTEFLQNYNINVDDFEENYWQKCVLHKKPQLTLDNVFNYNILKAAVDKFPVFEEIDFCASTFSREKGRDHWKSTEKMKKDEKMKDEQRKALAEALGEEVEENEDEASSEASETGPGFKLINSEDVEKLFNDKYTIQFHQPQRFSRPLWSLLEIFERHFHSLAGSNIYITPEGSQGLAPHYDNVDVFIIQLEGTKLWNVWKPLKNVNKLPAGEASGDFCEENDLTPDQYEKHDILMEKGDMLYFPRGFIHQAKTLPNDYSCHITISLFENHSIGDFLREAVTDIMESITKNELKLRSGLPIGFKHEDTADLLRDNLPLIADKLKYFKGELEISPIVGDFYKNRLPPLNCSNQPVGAQPSFDSRISLIYPDHLLLSSFDINTEDDCLALGEEEIAMDEIENEEEEDFFYVFSSTKNTRATHMMGKRQDENNSYLELLSELNLESFKDCPKDSKKANYVQKITDKMQSNNGIKLPLKFKDALTKMKTLPLDDGYSMSDLAIRSPADFMALSMSLWAECLIKVC